MVEAVVVTILGDTSGYSRLDGAGNERIDVIVLRQIGVLLVVAVHGSVQPSIWRFRSDDCGCC
jgi:hypothetical protein